MMGKRRARIILLCEDRQHEAFVRRFFEFSGWSRREIRVEISPRGKGSGKQWVLDQFPKELSGMRHGHVASKLAAIVDADTSPVADNVKKFNEKCRQARIPEPRPVDPVALFIPRRNIETWIRYLSGETVNEEERYPSLLRQRECGQQVKSLVEMCKKNKLRPPAPPSLEAACIEYSSWFSKN